LLYTFLSFVIVVTFVVKVVFLFGCGSAALGSPRLPACLPINRQAARQAGLGGAISEARFTGKPEDPLI